MGTEVSSSWVKRMERENYHSSLFNIEECIELYLYSHVSIHCLVLRHLLSNCHWITQYTAVKLEHHRVADVSVLISVILFLSAVHRKLIKRTETPNEMDEQYYNLTVRCSWITCTKWIKWTYNREFVPIRPFVYSSQSFIHGISQSLPNFFALDGLHQNCPSNSILLCSSLT
jgi:hypothetical protein